MDKDIKKLNDSLISKTIKFKPVITIYTKKRKGEGNGRGRIF